MQKSLVFLVVFLTSLHVIGQTVRDYFFDSEFQVNEGTSVVLLVKNPQSQFARILGNRIYDGTTFLTYLKNNWFYEYDDSFGAVEKMCGFDLCFYSFRNAKFSYFNHLNSTCGLHKIGAENLNVTLQKGTPITIDTLNKIGVFWRREQVFTKQLFHYS